MDKDNKESNDNKVNKNGANACEDDEDVFEDALEESTEDELNDSTDVIDSPNCKDNSREKLAANKDVKNVNKLDENEINNNQVELDKLNEKLKNFKAYGIEEDGIDACVRSAFQLNQEFFKDEFEFVIKFCELNYNKNIFYSLIYGTMYFIRTFFSFEQPEIQKCLEILNQCSDYVNSRRRVSSWSEYVKKVNYDSFTDEEAHAEITFGELQILLGCTTFIKDQNFSSLFRGAMKFKQGYQSFKYAKDIHQNRKKWSSNVARDEFYSSLLAGSGVFHLSIANAPPKVLSILEFIGFTCDEEFAIEQLKKSAMSDKTIKSNYALIVLLVYYCYTQVTIGHGDFKLDVFEELVQLKKKRNPNSIFTNYFVGKQLQLTGDLDKAILKFKEIVENNTSTGFKQINNACNWELLFLNAAKQNYQECASISNIMRNSSLWSPCVFTFIYGISLYMVKEQTGNVKLQEEIDELFSEVPKLRRRLAGKSTPIEKLAMAKAKYYFSNDKKLELPMHELMYYYNLMSTFMRNKAAMSDNLQMVEDKLKTYDVNKIVELGQTTDYCLLVAIKSSYLRHMKFPSLAIDTLQPIFQYTKSVKEDHLIPFATMELAFAFLQLEQFEHAKKLLKSCVNHSKYTAELILHSSCFIYFLCNCIFSFFDDL